MTRIVYSSVSIIFLWKDPRGTQVVYILVLLSLPLLLLGLARVTMTSFIISIKGTNAAKLLSFPTQVFFRLFVELVLCT
jgi:hypothetical protein